MIETIEFTGKSAGCPALQVGRKADPVIISTFPGSPCRACPVLTGWAGSFTL